MYKYYIAYGSNLNKSQMKTRCPDASVHGVGYFNDYQLLFKGSNSGSYLTIEKKKGKKVPVVVWKVSGNDEKRLDYYEGYPTFYYKKEMTIDVKDRNNNIHKEKAFVYIMHEDRPLGIPSYYYMNTCLNGYEDFNFNSRYLHEAIAFSRKEEQHGENQKNMSSM